MKEQHTQLDALFLALDKAGFSPVANPKDGSIALTRLPEFREKPAFSLTVTLEEPSAPDWESLFDGCALSSGRMIKGAAHGAGIWSRKKAVERAKQEKWVALWAMHDAGIIPADETALYEKWQDVNLP